MLPREHRLVDGRELNSTARSGTRAGCRNFVVSTVVHPEENARRTRFGFIVSRQVGNAVTRNRVKRRLREAAWELIGTGNLPVSDVVVRAFPAAAAADYSVLRRDLGTCLRKSLARSRTS